MATSPAASSAQAAATDGATAAEELGVLNFGDPTMAENLRIARRIADRDISVLLLGETGTGKGYFAKALHALSRRADEPFVAVNCAAIPETLIESELFGYESGAFTGATRGGHVGRILQADGGTLFLDEIGDMPLPLQVRLLSVIEDREVLPLGGRKAIPVNIRIISATHRNLADRVSENLFREDLYYRLNGITISLPPLRNRADKTMLIRRMVQLESGERMPIELDEALLQRFLRYSWPGNLRQLRNVIRSLLALRDSDHVGLADLQDDWLQEVSPDAVPIGTGPVSSPLGDKNVLAAAERTALLQVLQSTRWNVSAAAIRLQISRKTMYRKMHQHGLRRGQLFEAAAASLAEQP